MPSAEARVTALEQTAGRNPADEARIKADSAWVEAKIADMAARCTPEERVNMAEWWAICRERVKTDPVLAKVFAGFEPGDVNL